MSAYDSTVAANLQHMQTAREEWAACECEVACGENGKTAVAYSAPSGYRPAPSLFAACPNCCQLCGHEIKHEHLLRNDARRWLLVVGSECVCHFAAGQSGDEVMALAERTLALQTLAWLVAMEKMPPYCWNMGLVADLLDRCPLDTDPAVWMRRNSRRIAALAGKWSQSVKMTLAIRGYVPPRPPEAWLPENRKEVA